GKPTFHVETEAELGDCRLDGVETVGITAGASTPNWIIQRVYRKLEQMPASRRSDLLGTLSRIIRPLVLTNVYVALGAGCLALACARLLKIPFDAAPIAVAMLYVLSMHQLNHLTGTAEDAYNDPERAHFYKKYRLPLSILAIGAGAAGLFSAATMGPTAFSLLLLMSLLGLSYNLYLIPAGLGCKYRRIKDLPGSKTVLIAAAWGVVVALLPGLAAKRFLSVGILAVSVWAVALVFSRTAFFDLLDVQGDRLVGKETLPILLGKRRTVVLLKGILTICILWVALAAAVGLISRLGFLLTLCPGIMLVLVAAHESGRMRPGIRLEFLVESLFLFSGVLTLIWIALAA
ncbi:UbiA family prenyltransferase, partial [Desulfosarcina cetonica]|uniref:UbiA family prenyltransferase n=1 Tax=Desulfosarcina cetonica TaxID=90730 RepID=UPI00155D97EF